MERRRSVRDGHRAPPAAAGPRADPRRIRGAHLASLLEGANGRPSHRRSWRGAWHDRRRRAQGKAPRSPSAAAGGRDIRRGTRPRSLCDEERHRALGSLAMNVCTCPDQHKLDDYLLGTLESADEKAIDEHLEGCASCQAAIDAFDARANSAFACLRDTPVDAAGTGDPVLRQLVDRAVSLGSKTAVESPSAMHPNGDIPRTLGNYVLLEPLGAGGMGQVFKAEHQRMKRIVAVKVLAPQLVRSAAARARFRREIEAVSRLSSPHIVSAFDAGESAGRDYLVMEYVPGQTLADRVRNSGPLPIEYAMDVTRQAAVGLGHAHQAGIVHRVVTPSNILPASPPSAPPGTA